MKKIFARIGMTLEISDEEYNQILDETGVNPAGGNYEFDINEEFASRFVKDGVIDRDSYIPEDTLQKKSAESTVLC